MKIINFAAIAVLAVAQPALADSGCKRNASDLNKVALRYAGSEEVSIWSGIYKFGIFKLQNKSNGAMEIFVSTSESRLMIYPRSVMLETKNKNGEWQEDVVTLEELLPPNATIKLKKDAKLTFYVEMNSILSRKEDNSEYRLSLEDIEGCRIHSLPFGLDKQGKMD